LFTLKKEDTTLTFSYKVKRNYNNFSVAKELEQEIRCMNPADIAAQFPIHLL
jgi:hypothetical protein